MVNCCDLILIIHQISYDIKKNLLESVRQEQVILIKKDKKLENVKPFEILYKEI